MIARLRRCIAVAAAVVAAAAPHGASAQPELERASNDTQKQIVDTIREVESQEGPTSTGLIDPFNALALLYQESDDHALARAAIERARHLVRVNYGLYSLEEALLLRQLIPSEEALGNVDIAWNLEQAVLTRARRYPDDLRTVPIFRELAEKRMDLLRRYAGGQLPPQIILGCYYNTFRQSWDGQGTSGGRGCHAGSRSAVIGALRSEVAMYYATAIEILLKNGLYSSSELRELEMQSVRAAYVQRGAAGGALDRCPTMDVRELVAMEILGGCLDPVMNLQSSVIANVGGAASLVRLLAYEIRSSAPPLSRMNAFVQVADWQLLTSRAPARFAESTLATYEWLYQQLVREGVEQASIEQIFAPQTPVALPTFVANPLVSEETTQSTGYIDVAFDITKYGDAERIEVLDTTNAPNADKSALIGVIKTSRFRPRTTDGRLADSSRVVVRYYLND